jgi:hypothetical protein
MLLGSIVFLRVHKRALQVADLLVPVRMERNQHRQPGACAGTMSWGVAALRQLTRQRSRLTRQHPVTASANREHWRLDIRAREHLGI